MEVHYDEGTGLASMRPHEYRETRPREFLGDPLLQERVRRGSLELVAMQVEKLPEIRTGGRTGGWMADGGNGKAPNIVQTKIAPQDMDNVVANLNDDVYLYTRKKPDDAKADLLLEQCREYMVRTRHQCIMIFSLLVILVIVFGLMTGAL